MSNWNEEPVGRGRRGSNTLLWVVILGSLAFMLCVTSVAVTAGALLVIGSTTRGGETMPSAPIAPDMPAMPFGDDTVDPTFGEPTMVPTAPPPANSAGTPTPVPAAPNAITP